MIKATALKPVTEINTNFHFQNVKIVSVNKKPYPPVVEDMAMRMLHIYKDIEGVLNAQYKALSRNESKFTVSLNGKDELQKQRILTWLEDMKAVIGYHYYDQAENTVSGRLEELPRSRKFLNGEFLEIAIAKEAERIVAELAEKYGLPFDVKSNVVVATQDGKVENEFDIVIMFGKTLYVIEIKSGKRFREYSKYYSVGRKYGIVPDRILLVDSWLEEWEADMAEYFAEYYVATLESFEDKLTRMISADMEEKKYA